MEHTQMKSNSAAVLTDIFPIGRLIAKLFERERKCCRFMCYKTRLNYVV